MKLKFNDKKKTRKKHEYIQAKQHATKQPISQQKFSKRKSKTTSRQIKMEIQHFKICGIHKSSSTGDVYSDTGLSQERKKQIKNSNTLSLCVKKLVIEEQTRPKVSRRKEIRSEWKQIKQILKKIEKINDAKSWSFEKINKTFSKIHQEKKKKEDQIKKNQKLKKKLQQTLQKGKQESTLNNDKPMNQAVQKKNE